MTSDHMLPMTFEHYLYLSQFKRPLYFLMISLLPWDQFPGPPPRPRPGCCPSSPRSAWPAPPGPRTSAPGPR